MAGETTNRALAVEVSLVDVKHHLNHAPRGEFCWLVVLIKLVRDMAIIASHAQRAGDESHRWIQLRSGESFKDLYVLVFLFGSLLLRA